MQTRRMRTIGWISIAAAVGLVVANPAAAAPSVAPAASHVAAPTPTLGNGGRVIVVLKNQNTAPRPGISASARSKATSLRGSLVTNIKKAGFKVTHTYSVVNAVAATLNQSEANSLAKNSNVSEIIPDARFTPVPSSIAAAVTPGPQPPIAPPANTCAPNGGVQLDPEALEDTHTDSDVPGAQTARSLGFTGKGVTVGFIADGLDINNPDFLRNGHTIFTDYEDFSGDGTNAPTGGDEAFLDASAIGAQGNQVYDVSQFSDLPLNTACNIRIEGEAPGVNLVGLNVFGSENGGYNSSFLQAINYAVTVDHVNVLNESLGNNYFPDDQASQDLIKAANDAAVNAGVTVTVSSGDAGITNTIGTPATDPAVIAVGADTTYRFYLTTGYGGARLPGITGWVNDNISGLSSAGYEQDGATVSLVAPGDLNYALCSTNLAQYDECADFAGNAIGVEESGGTSESSPTVAGVAALVIEAYRKGHHGNSPSPAVVKNILTSTADDIDAPADQQGAGLVDAFKAVELAESYGGAANVGQTIQSSSSQFNAVGHENKVNEFTDTITNSGASRQTVKASFRELTPYTQIKSASVTLSDASSPKYVDFQGIVDNLGTITFKVPAGQDRLEASIAYQNASTNLASRVRMDLVDPLGRLASYSVPQGTGNYSHVEVATPVAGTWTAYITSRDSADGGTQGQVVFAAGVANYVPAGIVFPSSLTLAPGASGNVNLWVQNPGTPGDSSGSLVLSTGPSASATAVPNTTTVPVTMRSVIPAGSQSFTDTLTGGNGRASFLGQQEFYNVHVPAGSPELNVSVTLADNPNNQFVVKLVSPSGDALSVGSNNLIQVVDGQVEAANTLGAQGHVLNPQRGRWTIEVVFAPTVSGTQISEPFTVSTNESPVPASSQGLPLGGTIKAGNTVTAQVTVKDNGTSPEAYFLDPRLNSTSVISLAAQFGSTTVAPVVFGDNTPEYVVPTETTAIAMAAATSGTQPIQFDSGYISGDPDIGSTVGLTAVASYQAHRVGQGIWSIVPEQVGPFPVAATSENVNTAMVARTQTFDPNVTSGTTDMWLLATDPTTSFTNMATVNPGQKATIPVQITVPAGTPRGTTVSGTLYVDDSTLFDIYGAIIPNGSEVAALPYSYTVK